MDGRGDTRMDGGGDTRMDGGGGTQADGGGEKSVILAPIKLLTLDAGLWTCRACGCIACADALRADMLGTEACRWVECGRAGCEHKNKNKSAYKGVVTTVTFCNPHQRIPEPSAPFPSPQAQSLNLTVIPDPEHPSPITLNHSRPDRVQPDCLYLSLVSSSFLSLASSHTLPLPLSRSLHLTLLVLCLRQPYTT